MPRQASFRHALPTPASPLFAPSTGLSRPWVLIPFGAADLGYTIYYALVLGSVPVYLLILASLRFLVLSIILGLSLRWRARGGWVIAITGGTLLASAWAICVQTMNKEEYVAPVFLLTTCAIAAFEEIMYLVLVRLVPSKTFFLRGPTIDPTRSPSLAPISPSLTPGPGRRRGRSVQALFATPSSHRERLGLEVRDSPRIEECEEEYHGEYDEFLEDEDEYEEDQGSYGAIGLGPSPERERSTLRDPRDVESGEYDSYYDSDSSISDSSIIDLPPTHLSPLEFDSVGGGLAGIAAGVAGAAGAAVDIASGAGELVRRSASARFLGRSWASNDSAGESGWGYGTFGRER